MAEIPKKYSPAAAEDKWRAQWEEWGIHRWDPSRPRNETFVVDTPPPTVSGSLHIGHVFSYTHQDLMVRYQRMLGRNIHYGMGWDDNGLPTERRVQNLFKIRCDPHLPYDPAWNPRRDKGKKEPVEIVGRRNFIEACSQVTADDELAFENLWRKLGLSIDWTQTYATIDEHCRLTAQRSFVESFEKGEIYAIESPTMWDVDFRTAVAQAEVEDRERNGLMHDVRFGVEGGGEFTISTTRPELLGACIAVVAHPSDARYRDLFGRRAITPLFRSPVPIVASEHAEPEKGTGIMMVCTFGDAADVEWWKQSDLPLKHLIGLDGRFVPVTMGQAPFESLDVEAAQAAYDELQGLNVNQARRRTLELVAIDGSGPHGDGTARIGEPRQVTQAVKYYEKGDRPLEFVPTRQWFVRILAHKQALLEQGGKIQWHPAFMRTRYDHWVEGLNQDWCISRQRYFGVPFPVWYPIDEAGQLDLDHPIMAPVETLPVDPMADTPAGYTEEQRGKPGGFSGDPDVMDTWATSSLTPQIQSGWATDPERHDKLFPMDIRPQAHEIIRTWAFYTIVKAWMHQGEVPWRHIVISGWILDPDRKKMSKSKGNVVTPMALLEEHSVDAIRYWAGRARLGADTPFDPSVLKLGGRLARKIFNACRFGFLQSDRALADASRPTVADITHPLDTAFAERLREVITKAGEAFERFDYATVLQTTEESFWHFCDDYLELTKERSYLADDTPDRRSALAGLEYAISVYLRLLAPFLPYVTEEVWSWRLAPLGSASVHTAPWPTVAELQSVPTTAPAELYDDAVELLTKIRAAKSDAKKSLKWPVAQLAITAPAERLSAVEPVLSDVMRAGCVLDGALEMHAGPPPQDQRFGVVASLTSEAQALKPKG